MNLEKNLIKHGATTLAGLKTANLFKVTFENNEQLQKEVEKQNKKFKSKGVFIKVLKLNDNNALMYVYRKNMLNVDVNNDKAKKILKSYGYKDLSVSQSIERLKIRLNSLEEFPHEIGLFLGYPPEDVEGFICNKGKNCNLCGYWKVYGDTKQAILKFAKYDKCRMIYLKLWEDGRDIMRLTVNKQLVA